MDGLTPRPPIDHHGRATPERQPVAAVAALPALILIHAQRPSGQLVTKIGDAATVRIENVREGFHRRIGSHHLLHDGRWLVRLRITLPLLPRVRQRIFPLFAVQRLPSRGQRGRLLVTRTSHNRCPEPSALHVAGFQLQRAAVADRRAGEHEGGYSQEVGRALNCRGRLYHPTVQRLRQSVHRERLGLLWRRRGRALVARQCCVDQLLQLLDGAAVRVQPIAQILAMVLGMGEAWQLQHGDRFGD